MTEKIFTTKRGDTISSKRNNVSIRDAQQFRKNSDVVIIEKNNEIQIIRGIRAGVIKDAYNRDDYDGIYHWPIRKKRCVEDIILLCNMKTGEYSMEIGEKAQLLRDNIPEGYEIEFSYFYKKRKK